MTNNKQPMTKGTILIVDDTPENLHVLSATLSQQGYQVRGVIKGKMAIRAAGSALPDLILLDINMPDLNGYEVCEQLKQNPQTAQIPVIFLSALDEVTDKVKGFQSGGVDYITKPFQIEEVLARVENQLTIRRLQRQLMEQNQQLQLEIQERMKAEAAAEAASKAKSEFLANMSHELRTPLNAILGFTQVMNRDLEISTEQREYLGIINRSGEHLLELINDVLDLSKIEAGIISFNEGSFDLYRLLDELEEMLQIKALTKNLGLNFIISSAVPQYIKTDKQKLRCCLINLLGNAIKFTESGHVQLRVKLEAGELGRWGSGGDKEDKGASIEFPIPKQQRTNNKGQTTLIFEVEDTGFGITPEEIDNLFYAFVQTSAGIKSAEGTGLGLTITKRFVELMGGNISVNSVVGKGTVFRFDIQLTPADMSEAVTQPTRRVIALEPGQENYRILVVDDTEENRILLVKLLEPIGFEVKEATNGMEGISLWESWQPQLIFMDTRMPIMDGLEATKQIRDKEQSYQDAETRRHGDTETQRKEAGGDKEDKEAILNSQFSILNSQFSNTIIIALTASTFEERRGEILNIGSDDFVRKPFPEDVIFAKIAEYLGVRYLYEDLSPATTTTHKFNSVSKHNSFFLPELAAMPSSWLTDLYHAANQVREESIFELIEQIPENKAHLAKSLRELAHDFRLDIIVRLTKDIIK
ncbi:MAG: response regulator [Symploca sp. SIO1C2]|nr:response regulator [Symploca sp. SIO1C2]